VVIITVAFTERMKRASVSVWKRRRNMTDYDTMMILNDTLCELVKELREIKELLKVTKQ